MRKSNPNNTKESSKRREQDKQGRKKPNQPNQPTNQTKNPLQITNAGEDVEKREPSYTVGENVKSGATMENSMEVS